jgi:tryptophan synthase alpha chain
MTELKRAGKKALVPFITAGFPTMEIFPQLLKELSRIADVVEIGVPFSDPLADGPVIQYTSQIALGQRVNIPWILETLGDPRVREHVAAPLVLMSYLNPLLRLKAESIFERAPGAGVSGMIVPDLPVEEGREFEALARRYQMDLVYLIAPTTGDARARMIAERAQGFVYLVSITGVTGGRGEYAEETFAFLERMRALTDKPVCMGFGISRPEQVRQIAPYVDGVIIGSSLLRTIIENPSDPIHAASEFLSSFRTALGER